MLDGSDHQLAAPKPGKPQGRLSWRSQAGLGEEELVPHLDAIVIHCRQPAALAGFYAEVLGLPVAPADVAAIEAGTLAPDESVLLGSRDALHVWLTPVRALEPVPGRVHLDVRLDVDSDLDPLIASARRANGRIRRAAGPCSRTQRETSSAQSIRPPDARQTDDAPNRRRAKPTTRQTDDAPSGQAVTRARVQPVLVTERHPVPGPTARCLSG